VRDICSIGVRLLAHRTNCQYEPQLSVEDILVMYVEELRYECLRRELDAIGLTKPAIQRLFLAHIGARTPVAGLSGFPRRLFHRIRY